MADGSEQGKSQPTAEPRLEMNGSRQWSSWLNEQQVSIAFSTYQAGKLFLLGLQPDGRMSVFERTFERCMGLTSHQDSLYMSTLYQLWRFNNVVPEGQQANGFDKVFVPQQAFTTGDIDLHDLAIDKDGRPIFVNTLFSCLATTDGSSSFTPIWQPDFISKLAAEDRCHLNGLAMQNGQPKYVTALATTDVFEGWREQRQDGGVVIDVQSNEVICQGLSMPHSPRIYRDELYVLNSGAGEFGKVNLASGEFEAIANCLGYARGLTFVGDFAVIGLSRPRGDNKTFTGLALDQRLADAGISAKCGIQVVDLRSGDTVHQLPIEGIVEEIYDVAALPNVRRPSALGFKTEEIRRTLSIGDTQPLEFDAAVEQTNKVH